MARTHTRVSMSRMSTVERSFTAWARLARTDADSTSYCCAPAEASAAQSAIAAAAALARHVRPGMLEARLHEARGLGERHLGRRGIAAVLVLDHTFLQAAVADHDAVRDADQLLVGEEHAGALVAIVEERLDPRPGELGIELLGRGLHRLASPVAHRNQRHHEGRH